MSRSERPPAPSPLQRSSQPCPRDPLLQVSMTWPIPVKTVSSMLHCRTLPSTMSVLPCWTQWKEEGEEDSTGTTPLTSSEEVLPPRQAAKLSRCECDPSWFCSPHDACFIHESCLCEGSSKWPPVKPVRSRWVSESREWLAALLSRR
jgi:hypothetical protein